MRDNSEQFYVYVYIDPRNLEPFYYGKGQGSRHSAQRADAKERGITARIKQIEKEGQESMVRVIAKDLTEEQAFLVEKTLIWQSRGLTNIAPGRFKNNFRPSNTLHRRLPGFDYPAKVHYFNVGDGKHRFWEDNVMYCYLGGWSRRGLSDRY